MNTQEILDKLDQSSSINSDSSVNDTGTSDVSKPHLHTSLFESPGNVDSFSPILSKKCRKRKLPKTSTPSKAKTLNISLNSTVFNESVIDYQSDEEMCYSCDEDGGTHGWHFHVRKSEIRRQLSWAADSESDEEGKCLFLFTFFIYIKCFKNPPAEN